MAVKVNENMQNKDNTVGNIREWAEAESAKETYNNYKGKRKIHWSSRKEKPESKD